jgi:c-di-GMP-binding flagellar brake protein YcgR
MPSLAIQTAEIEAQEILDHNQFMVSSRLEITQLLTAIMRQGALITAASGENNFFLTSIVAIDDEKDSLLLECGRDEQQVQHALKQQRLQCSTTLDKVKIQFTCGNIEVIGSERDRMFRMKLPHKVLRLQRRENFRVAIPLSAPLKCSLWAPDAAASAAVELAVHDISGGGIAVFTPPALFTPELGNEYNCVIRLPGGSGARALVQARNAFMITLANNKVTQRSGFAFVRPTESLLASIQRYIMGIERSRRLAGLSR